MIYIKISKTEISFLFTDKNLPSIMVSNRQKSDNTRKPVPVLEMVRLAIPRRIQTNNHMDFVAITMKNVFERRDQINRGNKIKWEAPIMRYFTIELEISDQVMIISFY